MKNKLITVLDACGFIMGQTLFLQGTMNPKEAYPETFVTFFTNSTDDNGHFENKTNAVDWSFSVILYSSDPEIVNTKHNEIRTALQAAGFIPRGKGQDVPSDEPTHTGWAMEFLITEHLI